MPWLIAFSGIGNPRGAEECGDSRGPFPSGLHGGETKHPPPHPDHCKEQE